MIVEAKTTSSNANTGVIVEIRWKNSTSVLSDQICSALSVDNGSSEQYYSIVGWNKNIGKS